MKNALLALTFSTAALSLSAQAHELRDLGDGYLIQVGVDVEPPIAGQTNGMDFIGFHETTPGDVSTAVGIDKNAGDVIEVIAIPLKLKREAFNSPVTKIFPFLTSFRDTVVDEFPAVVADFIFPKIGTYGFIVSGKIKKQGFAEKYFIEKFVCGAGTQDTTFGTDFECVAQ
jgi:hypothetical protein